jgi:hypothetical protein
VTQTPSVLPDLFERKLSGQNENHADAAFRKHAVAGCTAGLTAVLTLHPLDVVKTRLQGVCLSLLSITIHKHLCLHVITCVTLVLSTIPQCHNTHARAVPSALQFKMEWRGRFQHTLAPGMRWSGSFRMRVGVRYMLASLQPCLAPVRTASPAASTCTKSFAFPFNAIPSEPILQVEALLGHHV